MSMQIAGNNSSLTNQLRDLVSDSLDAFNSPRNLYLKNDASLPSEDTTSIVDTTKLARQMLGGLGNNVDTLA